VSNHLSSAEEKLIDLVWVIKAPINLHPLSAPLLRPPSLKKLPYSRWDPREACQNEVMSYGNKVRTCSTRDQSMLVAKTHFFHTSAEQLWPGTSLLS